MNYRLLLEQVQNHILSVYNANHNPSLLYHNLIHIEYTAWAATQLANHYSLDDKDFFTLLSAVWFHDIGYLEEAKGHEERSADAAAVYLQSIQVESSVIKSVKHLILATRMPQQPNGLPEQIICDADLFHLGTDEFSEKNKLLRKEVNTLYDVKMSKEEWRTKTILFFGEHHYHSDYAHTLLDKKKEENLAQLISKQKGV